MTTAHTSLARRLTAPALALLAGAGIVLSPGVASANTGDPGGGGTAVAAPAVAASAAAQKAVDTALAQRGDPYVWGGAGPNSFDCSGLTQFAYKAAGVSLPHSSRMQSTIGTPVSLNALQPGDLVFFYSPVSHVAMYIGNGQIVHASTAGQPVKVVDLAYMPGAVGARRLV
ncbi:C40 family peptidase [Geodermatophilus sp. URMC 64]